MTADELAADLQTPWRHGEHLDARGIVLEDPLVLDGMTLRGVDLSGARLRSGLSARGAAFLGLAWLRDAEIGGALDLSGARFRIDLRAEGLSVDTVRLDGAQVHGVLALARLRGQGISLSKALVMANLTLEDADVTGEVDLSGTEIMGGLWAKGAKLGQLRTEGTEIDGRILRPEG